MTPDRSKRYAGIDGEIPRLRLATNGQLLLIALLVVALLAMIFPRKQLVEKLYAQQSLDPLTLSYIQNLYQTDAHNADVAILLARAQQDDLQIGTLEAMLLGPSINGDPRQRNAARLILVKAYARALNEVKRDAPGASLKVRIAKLLTSAKDDPLPEQLAHSFANLAFGLNLPDLGLDFLNKLEKEHSAESLEHYALEAASRGENGVAAEYYLMARDLTTDVPEARRLLFAGIDMLMSANLFAQAMVSANMHLGALADDPFTLRHLARTALAAGDPAQAARYAHALVFVPMSAAK